MMETALEHEKLVVLVCSEKGGVRKTFTASALICALRTVSAPRIIQIDDQPTLAQHFGQDVTTVPMPAHDALRQDDLADAAALSPLTDALIVGQPGPYIVDTGANLDGRLFDVLVATDMESVLRENDFRTVVLVPTTLAAESLQLAVRTARRAEVALPDAEIVPMLCDDGTQLHDLTPAAAKLYESLVSDRVVTEHPRLLQRALTHVQACKVPPWDIAGMDAAAASKVIDATPTLARAVWGDLQVWRSGLEQAFDAARFRDAA